MTKLRGWAWGACLVLTFLSSVAPASAQPRIGHLDPTFGKGGRVLTSLNVTDDTDWVELGIAPDGSAVLADYESLVRFRPDGSRDLGFGHRGRLLLRPETAAEGIAERTFFPSNIAVDNHGRVLVFGQQTDTRETFDVIGRELPSSAAIVLRYSGRGQRDLSFGSGRGFIREDFGVPSDITDEIPLVGALVGRVDSRNRPVLVAGTSATAIACYGHSFIGPEPRAVVRLTEAGMSDATFGGGDGISPIEDATGFRGLEVDAADRPVVGVGAIRGVMYGNVASECRLGTTLVRLRQDGERLTSFGANGLRELGGFGLDVLQPSGAMILSERQERALVLHRLRSDGERDLRFGENGSARVALPVGSRVRPVAVDNRGRVLLAGLRRPALRSDRRRQRPNSFVVIRLRPDGTLDKTFGNDGKIITPMPPSLRLASATAALDPRGRLLVAGVVTEPHRPDTGPGYHAGFVLARYVLGP